MKKKSKINLLYNEVEELLSGVLNKGLNTDETQELFLDLFKDQIKQKFSDIKKSSLKSRIEKDNFKKLEVFFRITNEIDLKQIKIKSLMFDIN